MRFRRVLALFAVLCAWSPARAELPETPPSNLPDYRVLLQTIARDFVIPRYVALADATRAQSEAWQEFCISDRKGETFAALKDAYQGAADAWSGVELVRYGPISENFRNERMAHWPERNNAVARGLGPLLARTGSDDLSPDRIAQMSVAVQGLTALERLLYEKDSQSLMLASGQAAVRRCAVGQGIAANLARIAAEVLAGWRGDRGVPVQFDGMDAAALRAAVTRFSTDLLTMLQVMRDQKVEAVLGKSIETPRPLLAEGWRSGRSVRAILINLDAVQALTGLMVGPDVDGHDSMFAAIDATRDIANGLPPDFGRLAGDAKERFRVVLLRDSLRGLHELGSVVVPVSLGITVGFNSLDGD